ncbi:hypothetical protein [uncultured Sphingomonas sp.]|uniref:hypothetical protein n=1 Tax=uncultured Sphingomonas sp. TaxID=158754 RepID=UPI0025CC6EC1|nr:hypothetical protein [uncultured Sphingomonas sp.]
MPAEVIVGGAQNSVFLMNLATGGAMIKMVSPMRIGTPLFLRFQELRPLFAGKLKTRRD